MAMISGGDMQELTLSNPNVGQKQIYGLKGESSTYNLGGYTNTNTVDGGRRLVSAKTLDAGSIECVVSDDMADAQEYEFCQACSDSTTETTVTFTNANGITYGGTGQFEGQISLSADKCSFNFKMLFGAGISKI